MGWIRCIFVSRVVGSLSASTNEKTKLPCNPLLFDILLQQKVRQLGLSETLDGD